MENKSTLDKVNNLIAQVSIFNNEILSSKQIRIKILLRIDNSGLDKDVKKKLSDQVIKDMNTETNQYVVIHSLVKTIKEMYFNEGEQS